MILTLSLSAVVGLLLGLLGGGGSILTVPMLVYVLQIEPKTAIVTSFVVVGISSLMAIGQHARKQRVCWKSGSVFGLAGMAGAFGGGRVGAHLSNEILMALFGTVTLLAGIAMLRGRSAGTARISMISIGKGSAFCPARVPYPRVLFDGFLVGGLTGLVGVGGGFLIVPTLTLLVRLPMQAAVGTSLLVITMNAAAGLTGYLNHIPIDPPLTGIVTGGAVVGSVMGSWLSTRTSAAELRRMFGLFLLLIAGYVLDQSFTAELLTTLKNMVEAHVEFLLGGAALALALTMYRVATWVHRMGPDADHHSGRMSRQPGSELIEPAAARASAGSSVANPGGAALRATRSKKNQ